jgi:hypothetical protein
VRGRAPIELDAGIGDGVNRASVARADLMFTAAQS